MTEERSKAWWCASIAGLVLFANVAVLAGLPPVVYFVPLFLFMWWSRKKDKPVIEPDDPNVIDVEVIDRKVIR